MGMIVFDEVIELKWWIGSLLMVVGGLLMSSSKNEQDKDTKMDKKNKSR